jgi:hypothetical protein
MAGTLKPILQREHGWHSCVGSEDQWIWKRYQRKVFGTHANWKQCLVVGQCDRKHAGTVKIQATNVMPPDILVGVVGCIARMHQYRLLGLVPARKLYRDHNVVIHISILSLLREDPETSPGGGPLVPKHASQFMHGAPVGQPVKADNRLCRDPTSTAQCAQDISDTHTNIAPTRPCEKQFPTKPHEKFETHETYRPGKAGKAGKAGKPTKQTRTIDHLESLKSSKPVRSSTKSRSEAPVFARWADTSAGYDGEGEKKEVDLDSPTAPYHPITTGGSPTTMMEWEEASVARDDRHILSLLLVRTTMLITCMELLQSNTCQDQMDSSLLAAVTTPIVPDDGNVEGIEEGACTTETESFAWMRAWASIMDWDLGGEPAHEFDHRMWRDAEQRMLELRFECSARVDPERFQAAVTRAWHGKILSPPRVGQYAAMQATTSEYRTPGRVEWEIPSELWSAKGAGYATTAPVYPMLVAALAAKVLVKHSSGDDLLTFTGSFTRWIRWLPGYVMQGMDPPQGRLVPYVTRLRGIGIAPPADLVERWSDLMHATQRLYVAPG